MKGISRDTYVIVASGSSYRVRDRMGDMTSSDGNAPQ